MNKLKIISILWSSINELKQIIQGTSQKNMEEIEQKLDELEYHCRKYIDIDDIDIN